mmetsp:Transcript_32723/g.51151  ORF Transcript_32723/g.51151 Transcript_32723/m.51151 type:complete len:138 (-) Transcript_32723:42-455(-)
MATLPPQFIGTWELDKAKSEDADAILTAQGVGWAKRKVICNSSATMHVKDVDGKVHIKVETTFTTNDVTWELGVERDTENPIVGKCKATLDVEGDKLKLVFKGDAGTTTILRWVEGDVMIYETSFGEHKHKRYYNKK